jgi:hypothetical protein
MQWLLGTNDRSKKLREEEIEDQQRLKQKQLEIKERELKLREKELALQIQEIESPRTPSKRKREDSSRGTPLKYQRIKQESRKPTTMDYDSEEEAVIKSFQDVSAPIEDILYQELVELGEAWVDKELHELKCWNKKLFFWNENLSSLGAPKSYSQVPLSGLKLFDFQLEELYKSLLWWLGRHRVSEPSRLPQMRVLKNIVDTDKQNCNLFAVFHDLIVLVTDVLVYIHDLQQKSLYKESSLVQRSVSHKM